ncbi:hypothetical protein GCK32_008959 [Trichostrongylus colubriformis]|uniref:CCHC-type domain-containing protein n=1 Tax=Trichostrongylus colubriformis TaxID=6319 RepID=A0AAN8EWD6_TRICO
MLYNKMYSLVRQFGNDDDTKETALGAILLNKLPMRVRSQVYDRTANSHNVTPTELLDILTGIVRKDSSLLEMEYHSRNPSSMQHSSLYTSYTTTVSPRTVASKLLNAPQKKSSKPCPYCKSLLHTAMDCSAYVTPSQRNEQARNLRLCFNCLSSRHRTRECPSKFTCRSCNRRHHSSLCYQPSEPTQSSTRTTSDTFKTRKTNLPVQMFSQSGRSKAIPNASSSAKPRNSSLYSHTATATDCSKKPPTMSSETQSPAEKLISTSISQSAPTKTETPLNDSPLITLMCATLTLFNPSELSKQMEVTAFLDSGSNKSYITQHVAATLQLSTLAEEEINVCTFATKGFLQLQCENHYIGIYTEKGARQLDVKSVPILTRALYRAQPAQSGDSNSITITTCEPSILIGNDYFWEMVLSENFYYALSNGYYLLHTTIGDIVVNKVLDVKTAITYTSFNEGVANPSDHEDLAELVSKFWKLEAVGIIDDQIRTTMKSALICSTTASFTTRTNDAML